MDSHYCNPPQPSIVVEKLTNGADADDPNEIGVPEILPDGIIQWTYVVQNNGNIAFVMTTFRLWIAIRG